MLFLGTNRFATVFMYFSDVEKGGETGFNYFINLSSRIILYFEKQCSQKLGLILTTKSHWRML